MILHYARRVRGIGWMFVFFVVLVVVMQYALTRTKWGRSVFAVGGNREAARRAGINVGWTYMSVFMLYSSLAAVGGMLAAGRLAAAAQSSGTGDVNLDSSFRYMTTGAVLLIAVMLDAASRRSRTMHGRA
ncbi:ABC transporter permease subunit [Microbacterium sp. A84]|uniref:ABC transporter permease subunit n=1 Tax=Microbacterium sp. A84 TaxID=3450715 RepID=UPI003F41C360